MLNVPKHTRWHHCNMFKHSENYYGTHPNGKRKTLVVGILLLVKEMQLIILILSPSMHQLAGSDLR